MFKRGILFTFFIVFITQSHHVLASLASVNEDEAIVRVWKPMSKRYGHASLETKDYYMSFWPKNGPGTGVLMTRLSSDESSTGEGTKCDSTYTLNGYTLNENLSISQINYSFKKFLSYNDISLYDWDYKKRDEKCINAVIPNTKWDFGGQIVKENFYTFSQSCTTFILNLLVQGGGGFEDIPNLIQNSKNTASSYARIGGGGIGGFMGGMFREVYYSTVDIEKFEEIVTSRLRKNKNNDNVAVNKDSCIIQ